jgi:biotin carboxyl carrier protein
MIYYARINGEARRVRIEREGDHYTISVGDEVFSVDHKSLEGIGSLSLLVNSRCFEASVADHERAKLVSINGEKFEIDLTDELSFMAGTPTVHHGHADEEIVKTPMPGVVVAVEVECGQKIEAGAPVVIVEAMKMQNEISSVCGGMVREILVRKGETVESNQKLVVVERV